MYEQALIQYWFSEQFCYKAHDFLLLRFSRKFLSKLIIEKWVIGYPRLKLTCSASVSIILEL